MSYGVYDQAVPIAASAMKSVRLLHHPHGMFATHPELINADLLAFVEG